MTVKTENNLNLLSRDYQIPLWGYGIVIYLASLLYTGYYYFVANQCLQVPLIYYLNDPTIYPHDPFAQTLPFYASMLWRIVAWLHLVVPIKPLLLVLFLMERGLVLYAAAKLALALSNYSRLAAVAAMVMFSLVPQPILGNGTIVQIYFEQTGLSIPFILLAMTSFFLNRPYFWAFWLGIAFDMNSLYGAHAIGYFGLAMVIFPQYRKEWKHWLPAIGLFLMVAFPAIILTLLAFLRESPDSQAWVIANQVRSLHHLFPLLWGKKVFITFFSLMGITVLLFFDQRKENPQLFRLGLVWAGAALIWLGYAVVGSAVFKSPSMIIMQPARATDFWYAFSGTALIAIAAMRIESVDQDKKLPAIALLAATFLWRPLILPFILPVLVLLLWRPIWNTILLNASTKRLSLVLTALMLLIGLYTAQGRVRSGEGGLIINNPDRQVTSIAEWAERNTPRDAVFLLNPETRWGNFRVMSKRPVFVTWKDGSALLWDRSYTDTWIERLNALGYDITEGLQMRSNRDEKMDEHYRAIDDAGVKKLQGRYKLDYRVVDKDQESLYPVVFETRDFKVLDIRSTE